MSMKRIKLLCVLTIILFLSTGLSSINAACGPINQALEAEPSCVQDNNIESEIDKKLVELNLPVSTRANLLEALQEKSDLFDNIYSDYVFWEWLISNQSATSSDISTAIEIAAKNKLYSAGFIDSLLKLNGEELSALLADNASLEKKNKEYLENLTESFFDNDISFHIDEQTYLSYFPEDTRKIIYLPEELQRRVKEVITEAVEAYPLGFVPEHLTKTYIIGNEIKIGNVDGSIAIATDKSIFLTIGEKNDETLYLPAFHHIFSHVLQNRYKELFDSYYEGWILNNPEGFEYYGYEPEIAYEDRPEMYEDGFITSLSMDNYGCDFAEIAAYAFSKDPIFLNSVMNYPRIRQKFELMVDFYNKIDPRITLEYFERISGQKLGYSK